MSGGLFKNSISKKAKSYYSKFERNGNVSIAPNMPGIIQSVVKSRKTIREEQQKIMAQQSVQN